MTWRVALPAAGITLALALALQNETLRPALPDELRLLAAFLVIVLLPGHAILAWLGTQPPGGRWLATAWALPLGVAWAATLVLGMHVAGRPFTSLIGMSGVVGVVPWILAAWLARPRVSLAREPDTLDAWSAAAIFVAASVAAWYCLQLGTTLSYYSDSPDHIGTIRRMLETGRAFPTDAFFRDAGAAGADPRKGLWHPVVAWIAGLAHVDPVMAWRSLSAFIAPLFVMNAACLGFLLRGPRTAALAAWALLLTYGGSMGTHYLREAVFATKLADQLALAAITAWLADLAQRDGRSRLTFVVIVLGAVFTHVFSVMHLCFVGSGLAVGLLIRDRLRGLELQRLVASGAVALSVCLPYLAWRASSAYAPSNIIHLEAQGLLELGRGWRTVSPGVLWDWMGLAWLVFPFSVLSYWRHAWRTPVLMLLTTTILMFSLMFNPVFVALLQPRLGYLLLRFVWVLPLAAALAFSLDALLLRWQSRTVWRRFSAAVGVLGILFLLWAPLDDAVQVLVHPERWREADARIATTRWRDEMRWLDRNLPAGSVVMSDPATSYAVPMQTRHHVSTLVDQHSSPNDALALDRILDARNALDPFASWGQTRDAIRRWGVTAIVLNDRFSEKPDLDYWAPDPDWFRAARTRLDSQPNAFPRLWDRGDFVVYGVDTLALAALPDTAKPRPFLRAPSSSDPLLARAVGEGVDVVTFALDREVMQRGDTVSARVEWIARHPLPAGQYDAFVRFERELPDGIRFPRLLAKPARKVLERLRNERYRFRHDHNPTGGVLGVDRWPTNTVVSDSITFVVPDDVASGDWQVQLRLTRQPHYPNYHLSDLFLDQDYYSGIPVDSVRIAPRTHQVRSH